MRATTVISSLAMLSFVATAIVCHSFLAGTDAAKLLVPTESGASLNTPIFAGVGVLFLFLTLLAHVPASRALNRGANREDDSGGTSKPVQLSPLGTLLIPMTIRFVGTFAVLAGLTLAGTLTRREAGFDVLFWYVSLTTIEVVGIVWASRSMMQSGSTKFSTATKGV